MQYLHIKLGSSGMQRFRRLLVLVFAIAVIAGGTVAMQDYRHQQQVNSVAVQGSKEHKKTSVSTNLKTASPAQKKSSSSANSSTTHTTVSTTGDCTKKTTTQNAGNTYESSTTVSCNGSNATNGSTNVNINNNSSQSSSSGSNTTGSSSTNTNNDSENVTITN